jgi:archaeosortase C (PEF-CTERM variant)
MEHDYKNIVLILILIAVFTGAVIEFSEGSQIMGFILLLFFTAIVTRISFREKTNLMNSKMNLIIGFFIIVVDLYYNYKKSFSIRTLDIMVLFLGASLVSTQFHSLRLNRISRFGIYISAAFVFFYLIFYTLFGILNIDFMHKFDHYFILLPTVGILNLIGIPIKVVAMETVRINGIEDMNLIIGAPCSGLYSMFLLIGIVFGYSKIEKFNARKTFMMLGFCIIVAYVSNLFRVIILYFTAFWYGAENMMIVHTHLGWIIFAGVAAIIMYFNEIKYHN